VTTNDERLLARSACAALVITCSDFRFKTVERRFAEDAGLADDYDLIARPGGIRSLVAPRNAAARDVMLEEIRLLWGLHTFSRVLAINHLSCRAYDDLVTAQDERAIHEDHLRRARSAIEGPFTGVRAETYLAAPAGASIAILAVR
jgi:hypothetical protein